MKNKVNSRCWYPPFLCFFFLCFLFVQPLLLNIGCASTDGKVVEDIEENAIPFYKENFFVHRNVELSLPQDWKAFVAPGNPETGLIAGFYNAEESLLGGVEYVRLFRTPSAETIAKFYENVKTENGAVPREERERYTMQINGRESLIVIYGDPEKNPDSNTVAAAFIPDYRGAYIIALSGKEKNVSKNGNYDNIKNIFASFKKSHLDINLRYKDEGVSFFAYGSPWMWVEDLEDGFRIIGTFSKKDTVNEEAEMEGITYDIFVHTGEETDLRTQLHNVAGENNPALQKEIILGNRIRLGEVYVRPGEERSSAIYFFRPQEGNNMDALLVEVNILEAMNGEELVNVHKKEEIIALFERYIIW